MKLDMNSMLTLQNATQESGVQRAKQLQTAHKQAIKDKDIERFDAVAKDFEAMFMTEMLKPMFKEIKPDPRFGGGKGEEIFNGMMLQEYGKLIAETGQLGIADSVKEELIRMQSNTLDTSIAQNNSKETGNE